LLICNHAQSNKNNEIIPWIYRDWLHFVVLLLLSSQSKSKVSKMRKKFKEQMS
jgi:hypothetical protein